MRIGIVILPEHRWWAAEPLWRMAEEYGFAHAWTYDHLGWRSLVDKPWFDAVPTLTAASAATSTIRLGTLVTSPNFRNPVHFAREVTALDDVSDGRFIVGLGAGGPGFDETVFDAAELTPGQRADRFGEFLQLLDRILRQDTTDYSGEYYTARAARRSPGCVQQPRAPFLVAANGPRTMRLAARYGDAWVTNGDGTAADDESWWRSVGDMALQFDDALAFEDRDGPLARYLSVDAAPTYSMSSVEHFRDVVGRASELGFTDVVTHWPRSDDGPYAGSEAIVEQIASEVLPELN
ncbi:LLM class flavin-dependent oxidoreductase [Bounagaea algeriensis]